MGPYPQADLIIIGLKKSYGPVPSIRFNNNRIEKILWAYTQDRFNNNTCRLCSFLSLAVMTISFWDFLRGAHLGDISFFHDSVFIRGNPILSFLHGLRRFLFHPEGCRMLSAQLFTHTCPGVAVPTREPRKWRRSS